MRLNQRIRAAICKDLIEHRFAKEVEKLTAKRAKFAKEVYRKHFGAAMVKRMNDLPEGWLKTDNSMYVNMGGHSDYIYFNGTSRYNCFRVVAGKVPEQVFLRVPSSAGRAVFEVDSAICEMSRAIRDETDALHKTIHEVRDTALATLNSFSSPKKLVEEWPEIEPFLRKHAVAPASLPSAPRDDLNKALGLPVAA
jgi:hypothetical protein